MHAQKNYRYFIKKKKNNRKIWH